MITPIIRLTVAIALGLLILMSMPLIPPVWVGVGCSLLAIVALVWRMYAVVGLCSAVASISLLLSPPATAVYNDCTYQATMSEADYSHQRLGKSVRLSAENIQCQVQGKSVKLPRQRLIFNDYQRLFRPFVNHNIRLSIRSQLSPVKGHLNHYAFDYEKYLYEQGIRWQVKEVEIQATSPYHSPIFSLRNHLASVIQQHLPDTVSPIILALLIGNRSALSEQQKTILSHTGSSHILAISGLHLALVGGWAWVIFQWLWGLSLWLSARVQPIQAGAIGALIVITVYALLTGFDIPVRRAWLMFSLLILSWLWLKPINTNSLLLAACAVMLFDPYAVLSVGFYFSFIATAIVLWSTRLPYPPLIKVIVMQGLISLTLMPITWAVFGTIAVVGLGVNLLIIPWLGLWVLPSALLASLLSFVTDNVTWLWSITAFSTEKLWLTIEWFAQLHLTVSPPVTLPVVIVIIIVGSILLSLYRRHAFYLCGLGAFLGLMMPSLKSVEPTLVVADGRYTSVLMHNGQQALLINPGRKYHTYNDADKWKKYLLNRGITLSAILLTDDKISHISATRSLLRDFPQAEVITLKDFPLPYPVTYCQSLRLPDLQLVAVRNQDCKAVITWFGQSVQWNGKGKNSLLSQSRLRWNYQVYDAKQLGAISITPNGKLTYLRENKKPWRKVVSIP